MRGSGQGECQHREEPGRTFRGFPVWLSPPTSSSDGRGAPLSSPTAMQARRKDLESPRFSQRKPAAPKWTPLHSRSSDPERPWRQSCLNSYSMTHRVTEPLLSSPHPPGHVEGQKIHACIREPLRCELEVVPSLFLHRDRKPRWAQ